MNSHLKGVLLCLEECEGIEMALFVLLGIFVEGRWRGGGGETADIGVVAVGSAFAYLTEWSAELFSFSFFTI